MKYSKAEIRRLIDDATLVVQDAQSRVVGSPDLAETSWFWMNRLSDTLLKLKPAREDRLTRGARRPTYADIPASDRPTR